ncbi:MAG TPA: right-handed parallel beta-helix repeat-containing protein, partial [Candidatus Sulfotelmatobacter sp.]|nr:right-handed parallel beta-helix repeat-containing protein [Candidatus Sulfotelmatobacter sp.]
MRTTLNRYSASLLLASLVWLSQPNGSAAAESSTAAPDRAPAVERPFDLQGFIDQAIQSGAKRVVVPPGRYRVTPQNRQHLVLRDLKNVEIIAAGVEMICTETTRALTITRCTNVAVRGLTIDYDPLPYTQGRITAISADRQLYDVELFAGYPDAARVRNFKYEVFRPDTRTLRCEDRDVSKIETLDSRHLRLSCPGRHEVHPEQVGDLIVIGAEYAPHGIAAHAVECSSSTNVRLEDIALFASNCFGFLEYNCDRTVYARCRIDRRSPETDPVQRAAPRLRSLNADAYHSKHAIKGPAYLECSARFMGDDCINICGDYHLIMRSQGKALRVLAKGNMNIQPGDPVELVLYTGERLADAKAVAVQPAGSILEEERAFLAQQRLDANLKSARGLSQAFTLTLDREVTIPRGGVLCAANRIGNGFAVRNCQFGFNRSRGILIKASQGEITGNRLEGCWMSAILVAPEYWWLEAGSSSDLQITGNTITNCGGVPIRIEATGGNGAVAPTGAHRNITIADNTVTGCAQPGILVTSTAGLRLGRNTLEHWTDSRRLPAEMRRAGLTELQPVVEINCSK